MMVTLHSAHVINSASRKQLSAHSKKLIMNDDKKRDSSDPIELFGSAYKNPLKIIHRRIMHKILGLECNGDSSTDNETSLHNTILRALCNHLYSKFPPQMSGEQSTFSNISALDPSPLSSVANSQTTLSSSPKGWTHPSPWIQAVIEAHKEATSTLTHEEKQALKEFYKVIQPFEDRLKDTTKYEFPAHLIKEQPTEPNPVTSKQTKSKTSSKPIPPPKPNLTLPIIPTADPITDNSHDEDCGCGVDHNLPGNEPLDKPDTIRPSNTQSSQLPNKPSKERETNPTTGNKKNNLPLIFFFASLVLAKMALLFVVFKRFTSPSQETMQNLNNYSSQINQLQQSLNGLTAIGGKSQ